jgi:5-methylcytosine-specific restriction endonuclease McrA
MKTATHDTVRSNGNWQGMNWIRQEKRLAIYLRDSLACVWCGFTLEAGAKLTLDHLKPHSKGGSNHESNLVTCCKRCNDSRGARSQAGFARAVAVYVNGDTKAEDILNRVRSASTKSLRPFKAQASEMITARGSVAKCFAQGE